MTCRAGLAGEADACKTCRHARHAPPLSWLAAHGLWRHANFRTIRLSSGSLPRQPGKRKSCESLSPFPIDFRLPICGELSAILLAPRRATATAGVQLMGASADR